MSESTKKAALRNISIATSKRLSFNDEKPRRALILTNDREIKQGLTLDEIVEEIKGDTPTGELFARIWSKRRF